MRDPNLPIDNETGKAHTLAVKRDVESRRKLHITATAGSWIVRLPIKVSAIAWIMVRYVRFRQYHPKSALVYVWNLLCFAASLLSTLWRLLLHSARPFFVDEWQFRIDEQQVRGPLWIRPLLGWWIWSASLVTCVTLVVLGAIDTYLGFLETISRDVPRHYYHPLLLFVFLVGPAIPLCVWLVLRAASPRAGEWLANRFAWVVMRNLDVEKSFLSDFPLLLKLYRLFSEDGVTPKMSDCHFPVLLVAAPLQILTPDAPNASSTAGPSQLWPRWKDLSVIRALRACLAIGPWFEPWSLVKGEERDDRADWVRHPENVDRLDLVDGAAVRHNPLPALLEYLKTDVEAAKALIKPDARVHLVYDVPIRWKPEPPETFADPSTKERQLPDIVTTALAGLQLARRRDSRLEVIRTNYISEVERHLEEATGAGTDTGVRTITVDEIAPESDLDVANNLRPTETEILTHIASGCRRTLSVLYQDQLHGKTSCWEFLRGHATKRLWDQILSPGVPGLPEVCRHCTRTLTPAEKPPDKVLPPVFAGGTGRLAATFPDLTGERPRIVFLASGGVFRGSFHIGMLGAMLALESEARCNRRRLRRDADRRDFGLCFPPQDAEGGRRGTAPFEPFGKALRRSGRAHRADQDLQSGGEGCRHSGPQLQPFGVAQRNPENG